MHTIRILSRLERSAYRQNPNQDWRARNLVARLDLVSEPTYPSFRLTHAALVFDTLPTYCRTLSYHQYSFY